MTSATTKWAKLLAGGAFVFYTGFGGGLLTQQMDKRPEDDIARKNLASVQETIGQLSGLSTATETHPAKLAVMNAHTNAVYRECAAVVAGYERTPLVAFVGLCLREQSRKLQMDERKYQMLLQQADKHAMTGFVKGSVTGAGLGLVVALAFAYSQRRRPTAPPARQRDNVVPLTRP